MLVITEREEPPMSEQNMGRGRPPKNPDAPHATYRLINPNGSILYVGLTHDISARLNSHRRKSEFWAEVSDWDVSWYTNRFEAAAAERKLVSAHQPFYNYDGAHCD